MKRSGHSTIKWAVSKFLKRRSFSESSRLSLVSWPKECRLKTCPGEVEDLSSLKSSHPYSQAENRIRCHPVSVLQFPSSPPKEENFKDYAWLQFLIPPNGWVGCMYIPYIFRRTLSPGTGEVWIHHMRRGEEIGKEFRKKNANDRRGINE